MTSYTVHTLHGELHRVHTNAIEVRNLKVKGLQHTQCRFTKYVWTAHGVRSAVRSRRIHKPPCCFFNFGVKGCQLSSWALLEELMFSSRQSSKEGGQGAATHGGGHRFSTPSKVLQLFCQAETFAQLPVQPVMHQPHIVLIWF